MIRRAFLLAVLGPVIAATGGCPAPRLYDPASDQIPLVGFVLEAVVVEDADRRLELRAHAYGYERLNGQLYVRYIEAGDLRVGGRLSRRSYIRPGEPEYVLDAPLDAVPARVPVELSGVGTVPACSLELRLPNVVLPAGGGTHARSRDLVVTLAFAVDTHASSHRIDTRLTLKSAAAAADTTAATVNGRGVRTSLVVPPETLAELPPGATSLDLRVDWRQPASAAAPGAGCANHLSLRTTYEGRRTLILE